MKEFDKRQLPLLGAGLLLGIGADLLLRTAPWGLNVPLWIFTFIMVAAVLEKRFGFGLPPRISWLAMPAGFFAVAFTWRDSDTLKIANGFALCCVMALAVMRNRSGCLAFGWVNEYSFGLVRQWLAAPLSYLKASIATVTWLRSLERRFTGTPLAVLRGLAIAIPLLLVFGTLLTSADASFEHLVNRLFDLDMSEFMHMLLWLPVCTLIGGGILLRMLSEPETAEMKYKNDGYSLGVIETGIVLGLLSVLFFTFIAVQFAYFFGGATTLSGVPDLSMADYARRGFFELVIVSLLLLPVLLVIHWLSDNDSEGRPPLVTMLSASLVLMLFAVMASAMHRMYLYQAAFGLTELRLYTSAFMLWLALVFAWFLKTVLFGNRARFAFGALIAGFMIIAFLDFVNPDALIVRMNINRPTSHRPVDMTYLVSLSADAVPALVAALPKLDNAVYLTTVKQLKWKVEKMEYRDWRSWNLSTHAARRSLP